MPSIKKAAEELLKIADEIETEAAGVTQFVCDSCNHTATLASINEKRTEAAKTAGENVTVSPIGVNDKVHCPACEGVMAYRETEASAAYYYDADKTAVTNPDDPNAPGHSEKKETPADEAAESPETQKKEKEEGTEQHAQPKTAAIDYDSLERYTAK